MTTRKNQNSILVLETLGVFLGLVFLGASLPVMGQKAGKKSVTENPGHPVCFPAINKSIDSIQEPGKEDQFGIYINKRPLKDFSRAATHKIEIKEVDLDASFKVTITGTLGFAKDGKRVILRFPKLIADAGANSGDLAMQKLAQDAILAVGDAGWFGYLRAFDRDNRQDQTVTIQAEQNETQFQTKIMVEQRDENTAKTYASALLGLFALAGANAHGDVAIFLKFTKASSEGKDLHVTIAAPKEIIAGMIQRELAKQKEAVK